MPVRAQGTAFAAAPPPTVQISGCVVDQFYVPNEGVPVRVLSAEGRLLGSARSGRAGEFRLQVPATSSLELQVDAENGDAIPVQTQVRDQLVEPCLLARAK